ncbi:PREDICTED: jacalin-related lectin 39-like isoform X2 [Camelina sativa]|uniref:Jacalin-related lectin 39-like isoform X2 n=1 Tax=Camelina sativa TaxID=90675 RepID=A0ABM0SN54_CAMSA|nr:PREDICTED: jacalin-related lectin 39-like isoform X2 [Camelina sativa]
MAYRHERYSSSFVAENGTEWDDGAYVKVTKIKASHNGCGITLVQFQYLDGTGTLVEGPVHGTEPFQFDRDYGRVSHPNSVSNEFLLAEDEYIHTVVAYSKYCVRKIEFETNKRIIAFGVEAYDPEYLKRVEARDTLIYELPATYGDIDKRPIVGFHGKSGIHYLHELGVYLRPHQY